MDFDLDLYLDMAFWIQIILHCKKFQGYISTPGWMFPHNPGIAGFLTTWFLIHPGMDIYPSKG